MDKMKEDKIAYLEAKLAEGVEIINEWMQLNIEKSAEINQLKQQLTESEKKYETLYKLFSEQHEIIDQYELECFEEVNRLLKEQKDFYVVEKDEYDKMVSGAKQFAKETAIAELEKVKEWLEPKYFDKEQINYLSNVIDQQIKELKGEK
jgi:hypothetical protein